MGRFKMPLKLQVLCVGVEDREILGSSTRTPNNPTTNMSELIAKAKLALALKHVCLIPPPPDTEKEVQLNLPQMKYTVDGPKSVA